MGEKIIESIQKREKEKEEKIRRREARRIEAERNKKRLVIFYQNIRTLGGLHGS
jgi:hypothetical protein